MKVELEEEYMWPFTSPTTCYSGARSIIEEDCPRREQNDTGSVFSVLSTALHSIRVSWEEESQGNLHHPVPTLTWEPVNDASNGYGNRICVGHASNAQHSVLALMDNMESLVRASHTVSAATLDEETTAQLRELVSNTEAVSGTMAGTVETDTASVTTASVITETSAPTQHSRRNSSTDLPDIVSTTGGGDVTTTEFSTHVAMALPLPPLQGWLVWKDTTDMAAIRATLQIDFRPLAMTLSAVAMVQKDSNGNGESDTTILRPVVWMGSADAARLLAYYWMEETSRLVPLPLDEDLFDVASPVMALDVQRIPPNNDIDSRSHSFFLALACQDGTIRCLRYEQYNVETQTWSAEQVSQVIVDGPLVCLQSCLSGQTLVGSLCGYVLLQDNTTGLPVMVTAELQQGDNVENPVLAVHGWDTCWVAIGTQGGALLLYYKDKDENAYVKAGEWQLPYSVHEICHYHSVDKRTWLLVTTRKSLHLLRLIPQPRFIASFTKERVNRLLERASRQ